MTLLHLILFATLLQRGVKAQCRSCTRTVWNARSVSAGLSSTAKTSLLAASQQSCINLCNFANQAPLQTYASKCYFAEYNARTFECVLISTCPTQIQITVDANKATYVTAYCADRQVSPSPSVAVQLTLTCDYMPTVFGTGGLSGMVNVSSDLLPNNALTSANLIYFSSLSFDNRFSRYVQIQSGSASPSPLDLFSGGDFTISVAVKVTAGLADTPVIEFLGSNLAQVCFTLRMGCNGGCIQTFFMASCQCSDTNFVKVNIDYDLTNWLHFTVTYVSNTKVVKYYLNGAFLRSDTVTGFTKSVGNAVTRLKVGTTECGSFNGQKTNFLGSIYCINLYNYALLQDQVQQLSNYCTSLRTNV